MKPAFKPIAFVLVALAILGGLSLAVAVPLGLFVS